MKAVYKYITDYTDEEFSVMYSMMSESRRKKCDSYADAKDRKLCILADNLTRNLIAEKYSLKPESIVLSADKNGKPAVSGCDAEFNYSHSGEMVAAVISDYPIGIDCEKIVPRSMKAASRFATDREREYIGNSIDNYLRIWTLKEAYYKCIGTGLRSDMKETEFTVNGNEISSNKDGFEFISETTQSGYVVSVCFRGKKWQK